MTKPPYIRFYPEPKTEAEMQRVIDQRNQQEGQRRERLAKMRKEAEHADRRIKRETALTASYAD